MKNENAEQPAQDDPDLQDKDPELVEQPAQHEPVLQDIKQYRLQMAGICTAAIGYWKEGDGIHPDYDTVALRDVAKLYAKYDELYRAQSAQQEQLREENERLHVENRRLIDRIETIGVSVGVGGIATTTAQQEPVNQRAHEIALRQWEHWKQYALELQGKLVKYEGGTPMILNTSPPAQRKPLTNEEILAANYPDGEENGPTIAAPDFELICFARQIEAAHGIKEKT